MRNVSHKSVLGILREHLAAWRRKPVNGKQLSREKAIHQIVEAHNGIRGPAITGIEFEEKPHDPVAAQKNNADRVSRWLDDESKDTNFMPVNFLPSFLAGLPLAVRIECVNELLAPCGLSVRPMIGSDEDFSPDAYLTDIIREGAEATQAVATLLICGKPVSLERAQKELTESIAAQQKTLVAVESQLAGKVA